jgi:hypothetical protein
MIICLGLASQIMERKEEEEANFKISGIMSFRNVEDVKVVKNTFPTPKFQ